MGYYTDHNLEIITGEHWLISEFREFSDDANFAIDDDGGYYESCKWYDHEKDLREFSKKYPEAIFKLSGEGEDTRDLWVEYYKNGKMQICPAIITFDEFDESKLK
jgi:hypothetical protein